MGVPSSLTISGYKYTFKTSKKNENEFIYRCQCRACKAQITINKDNILKILSNANIENISLIKGKHELSCKKNEVINVKADNINTEEKEKILARELILQNLNEPLTFHLNNLKNNNI